MIIKHASKLRRGSKKQRKYFLICKCNICKKKFNVRKSIYIYNKKIGKASPTDFCSRKCRNQYKRNRPCTLKYCNNKRAARGFCDFHYKKFKKYGNPLGGAGSYKCKGCDKIIENRNNHLKLKGFEKFCSSCYRAALRNEIFIRLGNKCKCCGENQRIFLDIDHIKGGGGKERKTFSNPGDYYVNILKKIKQYRILCKNCNWGFHKLSKCPHKQKQFVRY